MANFSTGPIPIVPFNSTGAFLRTSPSFDPVAHLKDKTKRLSEEAFEKMQGFFTIKRVEGARAIIKMDSAAYTLDCITVIITIIKQHYFEKSLGTRCTKNIKTMQIVKDYAYQCFQLTSWFNEIVKCELSEKYPFASLENGTIKYRYYLEHVDPYFSLFQQMIHHLIEASQKCGLFDNERYAIQCEFGGILFFYPDQEGFIPVASNPITPGLEVLNMAYGRQTHAAAAEGVGEQTFLFNQGVQEKRWGCLVHVSSDRSGSRWIQTKDRPYSVSIMGVFGQGADFPYHISLIVPRTIASTADCILNCTQSHNVLDPTAGILFYTNGYDVLDLVIQALRPQIEQIFVEREDDYLFIPLPSDEEDRHIVSLLCLEALEEVFEAKSNVQEESGTQEVSLTPPLSKTILAEMKQKTLSTLEKIMAQKYDEEWEGLARQREQENAPKVKKKKKKGKEASIVEDRQVEDTSVQRQAFIQTKLKELRINGKQNYASLINLITRIIKSTPDIQGYFSIKGSHTTVHIEGASSTTLVRPHGGKELKFSEEQSNNIITEILDSLAFALQKSA